MIRSSQRWYSGRVWNELVRYMIGISMWFWAETNKKSTYENNIHSVEWITIVALRFNFRWFQFHFNSGWLWQRCAIHSCRMCIFHIDALLLPAFVVFVFVFEYAFFLIVRARSRCICGGVLDVRSVFGCKCNGYYVLRINTGSNVTIVNSSLQFSYH